MQYRLAALSGASIAVFWGLIECTVFIVFFTYADAAAPSVNGLTLKQTISYVWLAQALVPLQAMAVDGEILTLIVKGDVGVELCRPLSLYWHWFAKTAAGRLGAFGLRGPLTVLAALLFTGRYALSMPASAAGFSWFLVSVMSAFLLCTAYAMLVTAIRLNITWGEGPTYMLLLVSGVLSGTYLPLQLWPDALQRLLFYQPFAGYVDLPLRLYVGSMPPAQGAGVVLLQLCWVAAFTLAGRALMDRKLKTLIVQGG